MGRSVGVSVTTHVCLVRINNKQPTLCGLRIFIIIAVTGKLSIYSARQERDTNAKMKD